MKTMTWAALTGCVTLLLAGGAEAFIALPSLTGARVQTVNAGSPAQRLGLETGDVIVAINQTPIRTQDELNRLLAGQTQVTLVIRDVRTSRFVQRQARPVNGSLGIRFQIVTIPELTIKDVWRDAGQ